MTDEETTRGYQCPTGDCDTIMHTVHGLGAHLEHDHNWPRWKADARVRNL